MHFWKISTFDHARHGHFHLFFSSEFLSKFSELPPISSNYSEGKCALPLPAATKVRLRLKCLLTQSANYREKKFYKIGLRSQSRTDLRKSSLPHIILTQVHLGQKL